MMRFGFKPLKQCSIASGGCYVIEVQAPEPIRVDSPALSVMTDLRQTQTVTVSPDVTYAEANHTMVQAKVHQLIVTGDDGRIKGVLTTNDLWSERPMQIAVKRGIRHSELLVRDIMTPVESLDVLRLKDIEQAKVGDIIATLKAAGRIHALVVCDEPSGSQKLRGIFSAANIAKQMGAEVVSHETARTFAEIEAVIAG
ncbi:MAG: hypothetical protein H6R01_1376 [Burkholderiaceae bacterium]|nr:hypothetical protein [Burkholderiaceae bacterium]